MKNYKVFIYLKSFSNEEISELELFVSSPFLNKSRITEKLFMVLKKYHPLYKPSMIKKERIFKQIYGQRKFSDEILRKLSSNLTSLIKEYIKINAFQTEEGIDQELFLLYGLRKRKFKEEYLETKKKRNDLLENLTYNDSQLYIKGHLNKLEDLYFYLNNDMQEKAVEAITDQAEFLMCYLINNITNCLYIMDTNRHAFNINYGNNLVREFTNCFDLTAFVEKSRTMNSKNYPVFQLELNRMMMILNPENTQHFYKCKEFVVKFPGFFDKRLKLNLYFKLIVYSINKMGEGNIGFAKETLSLYKTILQEDLGIRNNSDGYFPAAAFRNIVVSAALSNEQDWLEKFIKGYVDMLNPDWRDELYYYSFVVLNFYRKNYEKCLQYILDITYKNNLIKHDVLRYKLSVYYELGYTEETISVINSFSYSIKTVPDITETRRKILNELIKYAKNLIKFRTQAVLDKIELDLYIAKLEKWNSYHKLWFIEKAGELKKGAI